jgi:hypothetical protein
MSYIEHGVGGGTTASHETLLDTPWSLYCGLAANVLPCCAFVLGSNHDNGLKSRWDLPRFGKIGPAHT